MNNNEKNSDHIMKEWLKKEKCFSNDLNVLLSKLINISKERHFKVEVLGHVKNNPILLFSPQKLVNAPRIMFAAGFHGDEPAGCWGILNFLENSFKISSKINLSFIPIVNPTGFINIQRTNYLEEDPNRGYYHTSGNKQDISTEGQILISHFSRIKFLSRDIFVSLHEDWEFSKYYIYTFENSDKPGKFSKVLCSAEQKFFKPYPDGSLEGGVVKNGIIFRLCDGSFEDMLFHKGVKMTACTETPGKLTLNKRIKANSTIIEAVIKFAITNARLISK